MSDSRSLIAETVERLFADSLTPEDVARAESGTWLADLWQATEETGLTRALLRPENGGADGDWLDVFEIARAVGRHSVPLPVVETILGTWLLERAGLEIPDGPIGLVPRAVVWEAGARLERIPWGRFANHVVAVTSSADGTAVQSRTLGALEISNGENVALEPRDTITLDDAAGESGELALGANPVHLFGALLRSAQMSGALERTLDLSVQYASERMQFGKAIGGFQVIQQELARLAGQVAEASTASEIAFRAACEACDTFSGDIGAAGDPTFEIACAKIVAGDAAELAPRIAHQVHGAIGFTYEHSLHFATRRLWAWRAEFGLGDEWAARLGSAVQDAHGGEIWKLVTSR